jgi:hypothetical protein
MSDPRPASAHEPSNDSPPRTDRRRPHPVTGGDPNPRNDAARFIARHRLEPFHRALWGLAVAVFGEPATVVPHMRSVGGRQRLTFVVDAADPTASLDYEHFLPRERAFWTAYAHVPKPDVPFAVAIRPARGWCRLEALAPLFAFMPTADEDT